MGKVKWVINAKIGQGRPRRRYDASRRQAAAQQTRYDITAAARRLFVEQGYAATTMAAIAAGAGVSHETVYAAFGPKPALFHHLIEISLSGTDMPVPAPERAPVRAIEDEPNPARKIELFAHLVRETQQRVAPLIDVLNDGARVDADLKLLADTLNERHLRHMRMFTANLVATGGVRKGLSIEAAADIIWLMNSSQFYLLCVRGRQWTPEFFEQWVADTWKRLLLSPEH